MTVTLKPDTQTERFGGTDFHFCSGKCQTKFKADPSFYASGNAVRRGKVMVAGTQYTCPMHPEIIRDAPGACPICGMALEPLVATSESGPNHELIDMTRRFWIGLARATMANIRQNLFFAFVYNAAGVPSRPAPSIRCSASCSRR